MTGAMINRAQWDKFIDHPVVEWTLFVIGVLLIIVGIVTGPIPGPGGIFFAAPGLALVLKTSLWAKRRYVHFKNWQPKAGRWTDWMLRRRSARRREAIRKHRAEIGCPPPPDELEQGPIAAAIPDPPVTDPPDADGDGKESLAN